MSTGKRRGCTSGLVIAGLVMAAWGCSSQALDQPAPLDGGGVGDGGAGGSGVGGSATGGSGGNVIGPLLGSSVAVFNGDIEGFDLNMYDEPTNLASPTKPSVPPPTLSFDATQGSPSPGSLLVTAPFSGANQYVDVEKVVGIPTPLDWSGKILHVRLKVSQGTFHGIAEPYVSTTGTYAFGGTSFNVGPSTGWQEFAFDLSTAMTRNPGYNPAQVMVFGLYLNTGGAGANSTPVIFNIDSFYLSP